MKRLRPALAAAAVLLAVFVACEPEGSREVGEECLNDGECRSPIDGFETQCRYNTCRVQAGGACVAAVTCTTDCCISGKCEAAELCRERDANDGGEEQ